jgi:hypothetical protein
VVVLAEHARISIELRWCGVERKLLRRGRNRSSSNKGQPETNLHPALRCNAHCYTDGHAHCDGESDADSHGHAHCHSESDADSDGHRYGYSNSYCHSHTDCDAHCYANLYS